MLLCPNINLPEWKLLVKSVGSVDKAMDIFTANNYEVPTEAQILEAFPTTKPTIPTNPQELEQYLVDTGYFHRRKEGLLIKKDKGNPNIYNKALAEIGKINTQLPGYVRTYQIKNKNVLVKINAQTSFFDIPSNTNQVGYDLKAVNILQSPKADEIFRKGDKNKWGIDKILQELQIPKEQQELIKSFNTRNKEEILISLLANYSYAIEVNTATKNKSNVSQTLGKPYQLLNSEFPNTWYIETGTGPVDFTTEEEALNYIARNNKQENTQYYSNLTVPGFKAGTYKELRFTTPLITPSIKGHAQFAEANDIGWSRVADTDPKTKYTDKDGNVFTIENGLIVFEEQSDLFQKGREHKVIAKTEDSDYGDDTFYPDNKGNQFLQLLNKDNNWVTFFVKSIIQDSAKKGYEKVLFPSGNTASKVEGHTTLEEFKKQKEDRIKELERRRNNKLDELETAKLLDSDRRILEREVTNLDSEIITLNKELERVEKEGFAALRPIYNFYENTVTNTLNKTYGKDNVKVITDEYGNTWNEVEIKPEHKGKIFFELPAQNKPNLVLNGFKSFQQQKEVVDVMSSSVLAYLQANPENKRVKIALAAFTTKVEELAVANPEKDIYKVILANNKELQELTRKKLQKLNLIAQPILFGTSLEKNVETKEAREEDEGVNEVEAIGDWKDEWVFQYDSKDNALEIIKKFLAFTPKSIYNKDTNTFSIEESIIPKTPVYLSYDEIYEDLKQLLAGVPNTWEAMQAKLTEYEKSKPYINNILKRVEKQQDSERLKRQFVSTFSSSYSGFKTLLVKEDAKGNKYFNIINTDQSSVEKFILSKWQGDFKKSKFFNLSEGELTQNKEFTKDYLEKLKNTKPTKEEVKSLLTSIGITISDDVVTQITDGRFNGLDLGGQFTEAKGLFKLISLRLQGRTGDDITEETEEEVISNDPLVNNSAIKALVKLEASTNNYYYSNTFKDGEGNTVYSYTFNKFLTKEYNKLTEDVEYVNDLLSISFNKPITDNKGSLLFNTWLNQLATNPAFKSIFTISPFDTVRDGSKIDGGTKLTSMSDLDLELTRIALIQNSAQNKKGVGRVIKYLLSVPSKTTSYIIQGSGQDVKLFFDTVGNYTIDKETINALYSIAASEHNRTLSQKARKSLNKAYDKGADNFFFFPSLNKYKDNYPTDKIGDKTVETLMKEEIETIIREDIKNKITEWTKLGIIKDGKLSLADTNYINKILKPQADKDANQVTFAAADYIINSTLAKFNTHQTFIDDPAVYFKKDVKETWDNIGKRLTNLIAPFKDGMIDNENSKFLSVKLADHVTTALNNSQLQARLSKYYEDNNIALPYDDITGTDAAEYVTLTEELRVMYMYGEISTELYNKLNKRIKEDGDNLVLTKEELEQTVFVPKKPVYSNRFVDKQDDAVYREYIKTASTVLLPQFTKGLEIDKLRVGMEKLEKDKKLSVRAVFDSGTKIGGKGSINIWNEDNTIKADLDLSSNAVTLDRSNFGIQQEVPYDPRKEEIVRATQPLKLLFDSIDDVTGFRYNNKLYKGEELKELYIDLNRQLYEKGLNKVESRFVKDTRLVIPKLIDVLFNEGVKRDYSPAQLSFLQANQEDTDFAVPFWGHVNNDKEQSMLTSLWTNNVLKQKMPGGSYVLVSEEGMQGKSAGIIYTATQKTETIDKSITELLTEPILSTQKVTVSSTDPTDNKNTIEEQQADEAVKEIREQYNRLENLLKCLTK